MVVFICAGGLVRGAEPDHYAYSPGPRHLPASDSIQSSRAGGGTNRSSRHHVKWAGRVRIGAVDYGTGTRRLPGESGRLAADVGRSGGGDSEDVDAADVQLGRKILQDAGARDYSEADSETTSADVGGRHAAINVGSGGAEG